MKHLIFLFFSISKLKNDTAVREQHPVDDSWTIWKVLVVNGSSRDFNHYIFVIILFIALSLVSCMRNNCPLKPIIAGSYIGVMDKVRRHEKHGDVLVQNETVSEHDIGEKRISK